MPLSRRKCLEVLTTTAFKTSEHLTDKLGKASKKSKLNSFYIKK